MLRGGDQPRDILRRKARAPSGVFHGKAARFAEDFVVDRIGRADRQAGISGGGLNVDAFEGRGVKNFAVGDAIESDAAGEAQIFLSGGFAERRDVRQQNFFQARLQAGGNIAMALFDRLVGLARGAQ